MPLKKHKPVTPSRRHMVLSDFADITKSNPERSLVQSKKRKAGRKREKKTTDSFTLESAFVDNLSLNLDIQNISIIDIVSNEIILSGKNSEGFKLNIDRVSLNTLCFQNIFFQRF